MAKIGSGYGSECHLLRFFGRHRQYLNGRIAESVGGEIVEWLDFRFAPNADWKDAELKGLDFLSHDSSLQTAWRDSWPQGSGIQNWDAVGRINVDSEESWLLVEAKANLEEIRSSCAAKPEGGRGQIEATLAGVKADLGVPTERDWLKGYYQFCNRVAVLHFLLSHSVPARLLFVYFVGDDTPGRTCPKTEAEWGEDLATQERHVGIPPAHPIRDRIHKVFLRVAG